MKRRDGTGTPAKIDAEKTGKTTSAVDAMGCLLIASD
jgi:hypothetical protein